LALNMTARFVKSLAPKQTTALSKVEYLVASMPHKHDCIVVGVVGLGGVGDGRVGGGGAGSGGN